MNGVRTITVDEGNIWNDILESLAAGGMGFMTGKNWKEGRQANDEYMNLMRGIYGNMGGLNGLMGNGTGQAPASGATAPSPAQSFQAQPALPYSPWQAGTQGMADDLLKQLNLGGAWPGRF